MVRHFGNYVMSIRDKLLALSFNALERFLQGGRQSKGIDKAPQLGQSRLS
jgi:hypothetical protein